MMMDLLDVAVARHAMMIAKVSRQRTTMNDMYVKGAMKWLLESPMPSSVPVMKKRKAAKRQKRRVHSSDNDDDDDHEVGMS
jgi:hypothetical protein